MNMDIQNRIDKIAKNVLYQMYDGTTDKDIEEVMKEIIENALEYYLNVHRK